ncbi:guanylate cyclase [Rhodoferax sp.]|uniref:guanylate cyclase n=1 Tax=Rhodoferax sp. TaxID=50421 RepID=UPI00374D2178
MHPIRNLDALSATLTAQGAAAGLAYLNAGVPHRFTAMYRLDGGMLRNLLLYDKAGEICPEYLAEVSLDTSFCQFVLRERVFRTSNSATDKRLDGHPYQGVMVCYHGVPWETLEGEIGGTLCHFDLLELDLAEPEFVLLQQAAQLLPAYL